MIPRVIKNFIKAFSSRHSDQNIEIIGGGAPSVTLGRHTYVNRAKLYCWRDGYSLEIGNFCSLAEGISFILGGEHDTDWISTYPFIERWKLNSLTHMATPKCRGDIIIEHDVWIGHGVTVLSGVTIGTGAVIAAGALVRGDIPPYSIAAGVPAKVIKRRFSDDVCQKLLKSDWWNLPDHRLKKLAVHMNNPEKFEAELKNED